MHKEHQFATGASLSQVAPPKFPPAENDNIAFTGALLEKARISKIAVGRKSKGCVLEKMPAVPPFSAEFGAACDRLSPMELRRQYKAEATCHRNMLSRRHTKGALVHPSFERFGDFLRIVGPKPAHGATLDRINNSDREYAPGKVRWVDKRTQNSNKGDSLTFSDPRNGQVFTTRMLAAQQGVSASAIRKRRLNGWSDEQIVVGRKFLYVYKHGSEAGLDPTCRRRRKAPTQHPAAKSRDVAFQRMAEYFQWHREQYAEEPLPAPPLEELNQIIADVSVPPITFEQYRRHFARRWPDYRPHLRFDHVEPYFKDLIEQIDPDYVKKQMVRLAQKALPADLP